MMHHYRKIEDYEQKKSKDYLSAKIRMDQSKLNNVSRFVKNRAVHGNYSRQQANKQIDGEN